jgi:hypothetical protein
MNVLTPLTDLRQSRHRIRNNRRVRIHQQVPQPVDEPFLLDESPVVHVQLRDADRRCFADVGIFVFERMVEGFEEGAKDVGNGDVGHGAD